MKFFRVTTKIFDNGRIMSSISGVLETDGHKPAGTYREYPTYDLYDDFFATEKEALDFVADAKTA